MIGEASLALPYMLQAMDVALADEINEQRKRQLARHSAVNGHLLSENNRRYVYEFSLDSPWEPEDEASVVVKFGGTTGQEIKASIVTSTGVTISIATEAPLPPEALQKVWLVDDSTQLLERLRDALKDNDEGATCLGSKSFGLQPSTNQYLPSSLSFGAAFHPDDSQQRAIRLALGSEVSYIIGPPGTGKTSTLAAIAFAHLCAGRTILIAAHTNIAVDNAIMRLADLCIASRNALALHTLEAGRVLRYGSPQLEERIKAEYGAVHLPTIVARYTSTLQQQRDGLRIHIDQLLQQVQKCEQELGTISQQWQRESQQLAVQRNSGIERARVLREQEQARVANFQRQYQHLTNQHAQYQRWVEQIAQQQAALTQQQIQHKAALAYHTARIQASEAELQAAQHMNQLQRLFKGISLQKLARQQADHQQQRWSSEQALTVLQGQMDELYRQRADAAQHVEQLSRAISSLQSQHAVPSAAGLELHQLQEQLGGLEYEIGRVDALYAPSRERVQESLRQVTKELEDLRSQLEAVESALLDIEKRIVAEAQVLATTLAKTYMNSSLRERRFDVVILDEVSMAPLPAVYFAASRANHSVVLIGDPQQLPPIVQAQSEQAQAWLGRDLFALRHISLSSATGGRSDSILLTEQARMHPLIAEIARRHVYRGLLNTSPRILTQEFHHDYAATEPLSGQPLLLCDTGDASPVASAPEGRSRINAYHALCSLELARRALETLPERRLRKGEFRVGLITPYRKQAQLLQQLVKDAGLTDLIRAGTVHRFQGLEAEVIIFDTVESPGVRPSRLTTGVWGSDAMRLTNVAMTRAKQKLIVVANYAYLEQCLGEEDTLRLAIQEAHRAGVLDSSRFLALSSRTKGSPTPLAGSTNYMAASTAWQAGANVQSTRREAAEFLDETTFFQRLEQDIVSAKRQVIFFSPFIESDRTEKLLPLLVERHNAGIAVTVVCRSGSTSPSRLKAEELLRKAGVQLRQPDDINHEKFVFIDDDIAYIGSLNPLSQRHSTEFMERVQSPSYVRQLKQFKRVDLIVKAPVKWGPSIDVSCDKLPATSTTLCRCGRALVRKINSKTQHPFYGCLAYRPSDQEHSTENLTEQHLKHVQKLADMKCSQCGHATSMRITFSETQIVCMDEATCGFRQRIHYISS